MANLTVQTGPAWSFVRNSCQFDFSSQAQPHPRSVLGAGGGRRGGTRGLLWRDLRRAYSYSKVDCVHAANYTRQEPWELASGGRGPNVRVGKMGIEGAETSCARVPLLAPLVFRGDGFLLRIEARHHSLDGIIHECLCTAQCTALFGNILPLTKLLPSVGLGA